MPRFLTKPGWAAVAVCLALGSAFFCADRITKVRAEGAVREEFGEKALVITDGDMLSGRRYRLDERVKKISVVRHRRNRVVGWICLLFGGLGILNHVRKNGIGRAVLLSPILGGLAGNAFQIVLLGYGTDLYHIGIVTDFATCTMRLLSYNLADLFILGGMTVVFLGEFFGLVRPAREDRG